MLNSKEYALQYFDEKDDTLFALITPAQWLEFANQYGMYVSQNSGKPIVSGSLPPSDTGKGFRDGWAACLDAHGLEE